MGGTSNVNVDRDNHPDHDDEEDDDKFEAN
jgi:hypothetical protein